eukprot:Em0001g1700a
MLRDRIVCGVRNSSVQRRLLAESGLTFKKAFELVQSAESAEKNATEIQRSVTVAVNAIQKTSEVQARSRNTCYRCGDLFKEELGRVKGVEVKVHVDELARPRFFRPRPVPFALKGRIEEELERLQRDGIIEPVKFSEWAAPVVPVLKSDGSLRLCGDYKVTVNSVANVESYPLPRINDLLGSLTGGKVFSKLDLSHAYLQLPLDEKSKEYVTITTHKGLFRYNRMPFGVASAPAIFQRTMERILQDTLAPLYKLLTKHQPWSWGADQAAAFQKAKFQLTSDEDGSDRLIAYASRSLAPAEKNYSQIEKEGLAVVWGVKKFHQFLFGDSLLCTQITNHSSFSSMVFRPGKNQGNADGLSRLPLAEAPEEVPTPGDTILMLQAFSDMSSVVTYSSLDRQRPGALGVPTASLGVAYKTLVSHSCGRLWPFLGNIIFVMVDAHSKWLEAAVVSSTSSQQAIRVLRQVFSCHGLPEVLVSDNGTAFTSTEFQTFVQRNGFRHIRSAPTTQPLMDWLNDVLSLFPTSIPSSNIPNFELLGVPIGDKAFCSSITARKCSSPLALFSHLEDIGSSDPHVALTLLRHCASFCKLIHLARGTPSSTMVEALKAYDLAVAICFTKCTGLDISVDAWKQAQRSPRRGGLGLRPLSLHAPIAYISSLCSSDSATPSHPLLASTITLFNNCVPPPEAVSVQTLLSNPPTQRYLSDVIEESQFTILYNSMSCANKARLLSVSSPRASAWLSVVPSEVMGLHLNPCELNTAVK